MSQKLQLVMLVAMVLYFYILYHLLKNKRLNLKYTLLWIFAGFLMLLTALFPDALFYVSAAIGIVVPSNALFAMILFFMIIMLMMLTSIVSKLNEQVKRLTQSLALLEKRVRDQEQGAGCVEEKNCEDHQCAV